MRDYKAPEMEKIEYKAEDVLTTSDIVDNNAINDINDIIGGGQNTPTEPENWEEQINKP